MKLRNKKTGIIIDAYLIIEEPGIRRYANSIKDLCDNYEDYNQAAEPLIKDEKVRKAVRAWADVLEIDKVEFYGSETWIGFMAKNAGTGWSSKFELDYLGSENTLIPFRTYTIAELCGEEEE